MLRARVMGDTGADRITVRCSCGAKLGLRITAAGHQARCPKCQRSFVVPSPEGSPSSAGATSGKRVAGSQPDAPAGSDHTTTRCSCGKELRVPASSVGRKARCPACGNVLVITAQQSLASQTEEPAGLDDRRSLLDELAAQVTSPNAASPALTHPSQKLCPHCGWSMPADARLCVACGYDTKTGRVHKATEVRTAREPGAVRMLAMAAGPFVLGGVLSGLGALVGGAVWFGIAMATGYEIGWIAWGIGGLAGLGMYLGYRTQDFRAGVVAAGTSALGIVAAKAMIFAFLVYAIVTGNTNSIDLQREYVKAHMTDEILDDREVWSESQREAQWDSAYAEADGRVSKWSDDQVRRKWQEYRDAGEAADAAGGRYRLAAHHAGREACRMGLSYADERRERLHEEHYRKYEAMSQEELDEAIAQLEAWEAGGKWSDQDYVRDYLIYSYIDQALEEVDGTDRQEDEPEVEEPTPEQWKQLYQGAVARVDNMSPQERVREAQSIEAELEQEVRNFEAQLAEEADSEGVGGAVLALFTRTMFEWTDMIFFLLAVVSAYRIASGGGRR